MYSLPNIVRVVKSRRVIKSRLTGLITAGIGTELPSIKDITKGNTEGMRRRGIRRKQLLDSR